MNISQAIKRLTVLGFKMGETGVRDWGRQDAEPFDFSPSHIVTTPFRDVFIGHVKNGWYVTSHIKFKGRIYRHRYEQSFEIFNIFGGGKTLADAMTQFESNFKSKTYNVNHRA
jgi:hypothetical protein